METQSLLNKVQDFNLKYEYLAQLSGEKFNIFRILRLDSQEVRLHSRFLGELLNPRGSHGQKDAFLKLFVDRFQFKNSGFETTGAFVKVEKNIGQKTVDDIEGGRIDIIIEDRKRKHIIIENKIYARDQNRQLSRYYEHSPKADLFYLTLGGTNPSEAACEGLVKNEHYKCLSYRDDITPWLDECRGKMKPDHLVWGSITQYINLIKHLNNQPVNKAMTDELTTIITSNLEAAFTIHSNLKTAKQHLLKKLKNDVLELEGEFKKDGFSCKYYLDTRDEYTGFRFRNENWKYVDIAFQLADYGRFYRYGLATIADPAEKAIPGELRTALELKAGVKTNEPWWPVKIKPEPPFDRDWAMSFEPWQAIADGTIKEVIRGQLKEMIALIGDIQL